MPPLMADPEDQRRRFLINSIQKNIGDILAFSDELARRVRSIIVQIEQTDYFYLGIQEKLKIEQNTGATTTNDLVNLYLETQAVLTRIKRLNSDLDRVHHKLDFFGHDVKQALDLREQDIKEGHL